MFSMRDLRYVYVVEFGEQRPLGKGCTGRRRAQFLVLELLGLGDAAALARHDGVRRLVVDHEYGFDRGGRILVAISDERVDIGKGHVVAAVRHAGDRFERRAASSTVTSKPSVLK